MNCAAFLAYTATVAALQTLANKAKAKADRKPARRVPRQV
jgi:hypothetical protein